MYAVLQFIQERKHVIRAQENEISILQFMRLRTIYVTTHLQILLSVENYDSLQK
jgi:hypothetical protein